MTDYDIHLDDKFGSLALIDLPAEIASHEPWSNQTLTTVNDAVVRLGVIEGDPLIARAETKLLKRADKLVVLADASKFVRRGSLVVCPLPRIHALITDSAAPPEALAMLREAGVQTIVVDSEANTTEAA